jgi:hypothetical protein
VSAPGLYERVYASCIHACFLPPLSSGECDIASEQAALTARAITTTKPLLRVLSAAEAAAVAATESTQLALWLRHNEGSISFNTSVDTNNTDNATFWKPFPIMLSAPPTIKPSVVFCFWGKRIEGKILLICLKIIHCGQILTATKWI